MLSNPCQIIKRLFNYFMEFQALATQVSLEIENPDRPPRLWGSTRPYVFDENDRPIILIGPHWPLFLCAFMVFFVISVIMVNFTISNDMGVSTIIMTAIVCGAQLCSYLLVALRNPGVANEINHQPPENNKLGRRSQGQIWYCEPCNLNQQPSTVHCSDCKVCILEMDHHCPWTGKCIGKGNLREFYGFLACTLVFMLFNIIITMTQAAQQLQPTKQQ